MVDKLNIKQRGIYHLIKWDHCWSVQLNREIRVSYKIRDEIIFGHKGSDLRGGVMLQNHAECHHEQCTNSVQCFVRDLTCFICETLKQGYSQKKTAKYSCTSLPIIALE